MLMLWAIFPIFAQFFYTSGSYIQNYITDVILPKKHAGALVLVHLPAFLVTMVLLYALFGRAVFILPINNALILILAGAIKIFGSIYFYKALRAGDTADVNIFSQVSPLIALGLGVILLGESVTTMQGIGLFLIMSAALLMVFGDSRRSRQSPNIKVALLTLLYAFFSTLSDVTFMMSIKDFTSNLTLLGQGLFFFNIGSSLTVIVLFICFPSWRKSLKTGFVKSTKRKRNLLAAFGDNLTYVLGELLYKYGLLVVPVVAMMTAVGKVASLFFTLFFTLFLGRIIPTFIHGRRLTKRLFVNYIFAAVLVVVGIIVMN